MPSSGKLPEFRQFSNRVFPQPGLEWFAERRAAGSPGNPVCRDAGFPDKAQDGGRGDFATRRGRTSDATTAFSQYPPISLPMADFLLRAPCCRTTTSAGADRPTDSRSGTCRRRKFRHETRPGISAPAIRGALRFGLCIGMCRNEARRDSTSAHRPPGTSCCPPFGFCGSPACRGGRLARGVGPV